MKERKISIYIIDLSAKHGQMPERYLEKRKCSIIFFQGSRKLHLLTGELDAWLNARYEIQIGNQGGFAFQQ